MAGHRAWHKLCSPGISRSAFIGVLHRGHGVSKPRPHMGMQHDGPTPDAPFRFEPDYLLDLLPPARRTTRLMRLLFALCISASVLGAGDGFARAQGADAIGRFTASHSRQVSYRVHGAYAVRRAAFDVLAEGAGDMMDHVDQAAPGVTLPVGFGVYMDLDIVANDASFRQDSVHRTMGGPVAARTDVLIWTATQRWQGRALSPGAPDVNEIPAYEYGEELRQYRSGVQPWSLTRAVTSNEYGQIALFLRRLIDEGAETDADPIANGDVRVSIPDWDAALVIDSSTGEMVEAVLPAPGSRAPTRFVFDGRHEGAVFPARYPQRVWVSVGDLSADPTEADAVQVFAKPTIVSTIEPGAFAWSSPRDSAGLPGGDSQGEQANAGPDQHEDDRAKAKEDPLTDFRRQSGLSAVQRIAIAGSVACALIGVVWIIRRRMA